MTRDDVIRMARDAGMVGLEQGGVLENFERFADLVAAAEREACALVCDEVEENCWETWDSQADPADQGSAIGAAHCAAAIRARSDA